MTKTDIIKSVCTQTGMTFAQAMEAWDGIMEALKGALRAGETVTVKGLGVFSVREVAARTARNPKTGAQVEVGARRRVKFHASSKLL